MAAHHARRLKLGHETKQEFMPPDIAAELLDWPIEIIGGLLAEHTEYKSVGKRGMNPVSSTAPDASDMGHEPMEKGYDPLKYHITWTELTRWRDIS